MKKLLVVGALLSIASCGNDSSNKGPDVQRTETNLVNGQSAEEYYRQFIYGKTEKKDKESGKLIRLYHYLTGKGFRDRVHIKDDLYATLDIALKEDGTYTFQYGESEKETGDSSFGGTSYRGLVGKTGRGTWQVEGSELVIEGFGRATGVMIGDGSVSSSTSGEKEDDEVPGILLKFDTDIETSGLKGKTLMMAMSNTWTSYDSSPVDEWKNYDNR